ncbi:MAG TPA: polysaccharide biosynthesis tyrosine autokinase [Candidatus Ozemobacteraceae bacterium]|nr:polysaccharide biosynthesis tyrosine autokinase [Candidatus Ozemobacteraceae bacterium]
MAQETLGEGIWRSLSANRRKALLIIGAAIALTTFFHYQSPVTYESAALLRVLSSDAARQENLAASMNGILAQDGVLRDLMTRAGLTPEAIDPKDRIRLEDAGNGLVKLIVRHESSAVLQTLSNAAVQMLSDHYLGFNAEEDSFALESLRRKKMALQEKLDQSKLELASLEQQTANPEAAVAPAERELQLLTLDLESDRRRLAEMPRVRKVSVQEQSPEYADARARFNAAKGQLSELLKNYREKHPRVVEAMNELSSAEARLKQASRARTREEPNPEIAECEKVIAEKEILLEQARHQAQAAESERLTRLDEAQRKRQETEYRVQALTTLFNETVRQLEGLEIARHTAAGKIQVLHRTGDRPAPTGLSLIQREILGLLSGSLLAVVLLYSPSPRPHPLITVPDAAILAGGGLPYTTETEIVHRILQVPSLAQSRLALPMPSDNSAQEHDERLIALNEPHSRKLEPFKGLRTNLQILIAETRTRIVLVSSSRAGMGRTTLVANLGTLFAQDGYSVVLVDANLRKPALHRVFDLDNHAGLTSTLSSQMNPPILPYPGVSHLSILPSGPLPPNPAELLGSRPMIELLDLLKRRYDLVLIDTPPLLEFPDAGILASITGGVIYLSRQGESEQDVTSCRDFLKSTRAKILGFVQT